jgi:integrase
VSGKKKQKKEKARRPKGTGCVFQPPNSPFLWIKYSRNGKPYRESAKTADREEARKFLEFRLAEITTKTFVGPEMERIRVEELAEGLLRDYRINGKKSIDDVTARWELHLKPFFGVLRAVDVTSDLIARYVDARLNEKAANATINRELAALKRAFRIGFQATPPKVQRMPAFPHLKEDNVRKGFLEDGQCHRLVEDADLWFRALVECGRTYGWRISELLLKVRVGQVDLLNRAIRLEPGTTKNDDGREVFMTNEVHTLLSLCVVGKKPDDALFTRPNGNPVKSYKDTWYLQCTKAGLGQLYCRGCGEAQENTARCAKCGFKGISYRGLIFHDLRRTAARGLRNAGVPEGVIMKIGGWRTRSVFDRYSIVNQEDMANAMVKFQQREEKLRIKAGDKSYIGHTGQDLEPSSPIGMIQ